MTASGLSALAAALHVVLGMLLLALLLAFTRLARGPSVPDRVVALDLMASLAVGIMAVLAVLLRQTVFVDAAIVVALITFVGTIAFAQYLGRERSR